MKSIHSWLLNHPKMQTIVETIKTSQVDLCLQDVSEEASLYFASLFFQQRNTSMIVVLPNLYKAQQAYDRLSNLMHTDSVCFFPQDEFVTTEMLTSSYEFKIERLHTISQILSGKKILIVTHLAGYIKEQVPKSMWSQAQIQLKVDTDFDPELLIQRLRMLGYKRTYTVEKPGDFSVRGGIVDIFSIDSLEPVRLDFFGDTLEDIKTFEIESQRSTAHRKEITILPVFEFFYEDQQIQGILETLQTVLSTLKGPKAIEKVKNDLLQLENRDQLDRLSRYIPLVYHQKTTLVDLVDNPLVMMIEGHRILEQETILLSETSDYFLSLEDYLHVGFQPIIPLKETSKCDLIRTEALVKSESINSSEIVSFLTKTPIRYEGDQEFLIRDLFQMARHHSVLVACKNLSSLNHLADLLRQKAIPFEVIGPSEPLIKQTIQLTITDQYVDVIFEDGDLAIITEGLFGRKQVPYKRGRYRSVYQNTKRLTSISDLKPGDYVVHYDYGIGRFIEIVTMELGKTKNDYIHIEYRDEDKLYIPFDAIDQIQKYAGSEGFEPRLSKLGGTDWSKTKQRVRTKVRDIADKLIALYAEREKSVGYAFVSDDPMQKSFEEDFEFEETPDQLRAIQEVKQDMQMDKPMDRLLCGDVGFGKTEVAMRAAFKAVLSNKQVAYLAPTTVLAKQHAETFKRRMEKFGVSVALLNRFVSRKEQTITLKKLQEGLVDILIGTHRILSKDVVFKDLGLLIIDEEQRFGVEHKEKIKEMKVNIDVISLSATPIPRTLQMAIMGVKNMSLLETAPENRYPIQTYVLERNDVIIKDAIERELARNGQVFYLYNRVDDILNIETKIQKIVPEARVAIAHGQMSKTELEQVVDDFIEQKIDVLIATTIIETGIDIPNANTLIIHDADRLGLSQLYQIRGRVGRSNRIAYAYLMYQKNKVLTEDAEKRLQVIKEFTELGSGFKIAVRDLSIRGAGDVLGSEQSGFIDSVGIDLYLRILQEEIASKQGKPTSSQPIAKIKANVSKYIDKTYVEDDFVKLEMHGKISKVESFAMLEDLLDEFSDRFGSYKQELELYLYERLFEHYSTKFEAERFVETKTNVTLIISEAGTKRLAGDQLFRFGQEVSRFLRFTYKDNKIHIILDTIRLEKHWLYTMVDFLEKVNQT